MLNDTLRNYEDYGRATTWSKVQTLRFNEGKYCVDEREVDFKEVQLVANMPTLSIGWVRWDSGCPVKEIMGRVSEGFRPPRREELGDLDTSLWETSAQDPWRRTQEIILWDLDEDGCYRLVIDVGDGGQLEDTPTGVESLGLLALVYAAHRRAVPPRLSLADLRTAAMARKGVTV